MTPISNTPVDKLEISNPDSPSSRLRPVVEPGTPSGNVFSGTDIRGGVSPFLEKALWSLATSCCTVILIGAVYGVSEAVKANGPSENLPLVNATMNNLSQSPASAESPLSPMFTMLILTGLAAMQAMLQG